MSVFIGEFLESSFNTILEVMLKSFSRDGFGSPDMVLLTPASAEVSTDIWLEVLPVVA